MTHWEYAEGVERFGRVMEALKISAEISRQGGVEGDTIMIGEYDFEFVPSAGLGDGGAGSGSQFVNPFIPQELLDRERRDRERAEAEESYYAGLSMEVDIDIDSDIVMDDDLEWEGDADVVIDDSEFISFSQAQED